MKQKSQYLGIVLGVIYGITIRLLGDTEKFQEFYNIYSSISIRIILSYSFKFIYAYFNNVYFR